MISHESIIKRAEKFVKDQFKHDSSGHDWWHIERVRRMAVNLAIKEGADPFICELAALLHDVADEKLNTSKEAGMAKVIHWLETHSEDSGLNQQIIQIISTMSYRGGQNPPMQTLEGKIVQDADRLDAIGAIGIARTFTYAGWKCQLMHDPESSLKHVTSQNDDRHHQATAIHHFYEKLLKLKDLMNTEHAKKLAASRHQYMEDYLQQFYREWDSSDGEIV